MANNNQHSMLDKTVKTPCSVNEYCSGCQYWSLDYSAQAILKTQELRKLLNEKSIQTPEIIDFLSSGTAFLRDRLDFSFENKAFGLYKKNTKEILDIAECAQLSPVLQEWLTEVRKISWPFNKGSIRLRVGPQGQRGIWLDLANWDIKALLDEKTILLALMAQSHVEIGQRRKTPILMNNKLKLEDPIQSIWFQTWVGEQSVDLYCQVASFTQPSLKANKVICNKISEWIADFPQARVIEFGSGIGNLTFPAAITAKSVLACEIDRLSLEGLQASLSNLPKDLIYLRDKIKIHAGDFQKKIKQDFSEFDGVLANPPRSGLMGFLDSLGNLEAHQRPSFFIYMSCFPETLAQDLVRLNQFGYQIQKICIVDQFPQTKHFEVITLLQRK